MSLSNRLSRAKNKRALPDVYKNLPEQAARIIQLIKANLKTSESYYDAMPATWVEWDRLRQDATFKNEARPEFIYSFDAFVGEFGTCASARKKHLSKMNKDHTTWTTHNTHWSKSRATR